MVLYVIESGGEGKMSSGGRVDEKCWISEPSSCIDAISGNGALSAG